MSLSFMSHSSANLEQSWWYLYSCADSDFMHLCMFSVFDWPFYRISKNHISFRKSKIWPNSNFSDISGWLILHNSPGLSFGVIVKAERASQWQFSHYLKNFYTYYSKIFKNWFNLSWGAFSCCFFTTKFLLSIVFYFLTISFLANLPVKLLLCSLIFKNYFLGIKQPTYSTCLLIKGKD